MTLTKAELVERVSEELSMNRAEVRGLVEIFFEEIRATLEQGQEVRLSAFGNFQVRDKRERPGRNPKTGEDIPIKARRVVTFRASQKLKERVSPGAEPATVDAQTP